jgi:hypothetical protein
MAKLKLNPEPTFKGKVQIPVHGGADAEVEFTFRHRSTDDLADWMKALEGRNKADLILEMALGWDLTDPFNADSVKTLLSNYAGSFDRVLEKYLAEMLQAKEKN